MPGVSLIPAATPISTPPNRAVPSLTRAPPRASSARSPTTNSAINAFIWPYSRFVRIGSSQIATMPNPNATRIACSRVSQTGTGGNRSARYETTGSTITEAAVTSTRAATAGRTASGAKAIAANGGYVNCRSQENRS